MSALKIHLPLYLFTWLYSFAHSHKAFDGEKKISVSNRTKFIHILWDLYEIH